MPTQIFTLETLLKRYKINKAEFGTMLYYKTKQGTYSALKSKNKRRKELHYSFLLVRLLRRKGVDLESLLVSIDSTSHK